MERAVNPNRSKTRRSSILLSAIFVVLCVLIITPILYMISISLTAEGSIYREGYRLIPREFSTLAYEYIFRNPDQILGAYRVTFMVTVVGTCINLLVTSMVAFALSRRDFRLRSIVSFIIFFTLLFRGGLIPWYMLISQYLNLRDSFWVLVLPYLASPWYVLLMRGFLQGIPNEIYESTKIDGASEYRVYLSIVLPLSKPGIATVGLFYALMYWNDWWLGLLFIERTDLVSIQLLLHRIMTSIEVLMSNIRVIAALNVDISELPSESARMAMAVLAMLPAVVIFPFFQRFFVRGLTVGSLKG